MAPVSDAKVLRESAYVAMRYMLGARASDLLVGLALPRASTRSLAAALAHPEREVRAQVLAKEMARLLLALKRMESL